MAKEILIYGAFYDYMAEAYMREMESFKDDDITARIMSNGGDPEVSFGMISKWKSHPNIKSTITDGYARSTAAYFLCYTDYNKCLDVSKFLFHRAAFPSFIENNPELFTESRRQEVIDINSDLRAALEGKVNVEIFERITGVTMDQLFSLDGRIDVKLDAKQAKKVGLIDEIEVITPTIKADIDSRINKIAALYDDELETVESSSDTENEIQTIDYTMDLSKLKAEHPHVYAQAVQEGLVKGVKQEKERVQAFMVFADVDLNAVKDGIKGDDPLSTVQMAEFVKKTASAEYLASTEADSSDTVTTTASADSDEIQVETEISKFEAEVKQNLQLN